MAWNQYRCRIRIRDTITDIGTPPRSSVGRIRAFLFGSGPDPDPGLNKVIWCV
jgi:hypothetical protein